MKKFLSTSSREDGFTLIELLVVVIIIAILAAIAVPVYIGIQNNAKKSSLQSDVATTKLNVAAVLTEDGTIATGSYVNDGGSSSTSTAGGAALIQRSASPADEVVTVVKLDNGNYTVSATSASLNYTVTYTSADGQTVSGGAAASGASGSSGTTVVSWDMEGAAPTGIQNVSYHASVQTVSGAHSGTQAFVTNASDNQAEVALFFPASDFKLGKTYTISAWVRGNGNIDFWPNDGATNTRVSYTVNGTWQKISATYTPPSDGTRSAFLEIAQNYYNYNSTQVDDVTLVEN